MADGLAEQGIWLCGSGELLGGLVSAPARMGFQQGGLLERLAPGPELAVFLQDPICVGPRIPGSDAGDAYRPEDAPASGHDPRDVSGVDEDAAALHGKAGALGLLGDDALTGVVRGWRRLGSWAAAMEHAAVAELAGRRIDEARSEGCWTMEACRYAAAEVAAALTLTRTAAESLVDRALSLAELPATRAALAAGQIDVPKALAIVNGVTGLSNELARAVEQQVLPAAPARQPDNCGRQ